MPIFHRSAIALALCASLCGTVGAATATDTFANASHASFFDHKAEGWWWYVDPVPEEEKKPEKKPLPPVASIPKAEAKNEKEPPAPFSLAWVKAMLPKYMEKAWNDPTEENVEAYFLVQRFAMDKANDFADMSQKVVAGNTALDESMRRSLSSPGATAANIKYADKTTELLKKIGEHAGLWFFFKSDCRYCEAQAPILGFLESDGFPVLAVSIDGGELRTRQFAHTYKDAGQAEQLGVTATPTMFLVSEDGRFDALGMSVLTLADLRQRILIVGVRNGWISEEEYKEATPIMNPNQQRNLGKELPELLKASVENPAELFGSKESSKTMNALAKADMTGLTDKDNFIDPKKLVELVGKRQTGVIPEAQNFDLEVLHHAETP